MSEFVKSDSDERGVNNVVRHEYRILSDAEKKSMKEIKDHGMDFLKLLDTLDASREISIAKTKIEEAVMWAVKSVTK